MLKETDIWDTQKMLRTFWVNKEEKSSKNTNTCAVVENLGTRILGNVLSHG